VNNLRRAAVYAAAVMLLVVMGCAEPDPNEEQSRPADFGFQKSPHDAMLADGKLAYERYCIGCHGVAGDGNGEAAKFLHPRPRNFQLASFKFSSTRSGLMPTDEDLRRSIRFGLKGSAMPDWPQLPDRTIDSLIVYIKTFSPKWVERGASSPIPRVDDPYRSTPDKSAAIARGEAVYHGYATCWTCHPSYVPAERINDYLAAFNSPPRPGFRENVHRSEGKYNTEGEMIYPPDFHRDFIKAGMTADDLYRSIAAGISGTAMPTWVDSMHYADDTGKPLVSTPDLWAMAYYVQHLIAQRPRLLAEGGYEVRPHPRPIYFDGPPPPPPANAGFEDTGEVFDE
jgi:cytochrome c5